MTPERLTRQAIRAIQRKRRKAGRPLTREEVLRLPVQTAEPWKRIGIVVFGLLFGVLAEIFRRSDGPRWLWWVTGMCSVTLILIGWYGRRGKIGREINKVPDDWPQIILNAISNALF